MFWALPYGVLIRALAYRKDLFEQAGLDPNKPPKDWAELESYARQLTRPEKGTYGLRFSMGPQAAWDWITFLWSMGSDAVVYNAEADRWDAVFDDDGAAESLLFFVNLHTKPWPDSSGNIQQGFCYTDPDSRKMAQMWEDGKIGMQLTYLEEDQIGRNIDPEVVGLAPIPLSPIGKRGSELNCTMMGIFADIKPRNGYTKEEIKRAAWRYMHFYDSDDARRIRTKVFVEAGFGKLYNPMHLKKYGYEEYLELVPKGLAEHV